VDTIRDNIQFGAGSVSFAVCFADGSINVLSGSATYNLSRAEAMQLRDWLDRLYTMPVETDG
jgi:hypothetical protein